MSQHVAVVAERVRPAEHGGGLELDQVGEPLGEVRFLPRQIHFAAAIEAAVGPADLPAVEQVLVEQRDPLRTAAETWRRRSSPSAALVRWLAWAGTRPVAICGRR